MCPNQCVLCEGEEEDNYHLLFWCNNAEQIWRRFDQWPIVQQLRQHNMNVKDIVFAVLQALSNILNKLHEYSV